MGGVLCCSGVVVDGGIRCLNVSTCCVWWCLLSLGALVLTIAFSLFDQTVCPSSTSCCFRPGSYKLFGTGPGRIKPEMISKYYRYNSGSKCFVELKGAKHTTSTTCGVQLLPGCYQQRGKGGGGGGKPLFMRGGE